MKPLLLIVTVPGVLALADDTHSAAAKQEQQRPAVAVAKAQSPFTLTLQVNKSMVLERPEGVRRISISNPDIAEAVAVSVTEILINGKSTGDTNLILWDPKGNRSTFDITVSSDSRSVESVQSQLDSELGPGITVTSDGKNVFLRGTAQDVISADRAVNIASTLGKVVNLLHVNVPPSTTQILLKVRFATVSRSAAEQYGFNVFSANAKGIGNSTTTQYGSYPSLTGTPGGSALSFQDLLNIFYFRPDLNIGAYIQALQEKNILQILAEPNLLTGSGQPASFLAGGEYPFPTIQGGASGVGQITIQFKEYGIRLNFLPVVTPRGSILLKVTPEVSSLDYTNGLTTNGYTIPGLSTRRVQTEVELENEQSFVIAGLLDKQITEQLNRIPGLANLPILGKLFQSKSYQANDTELLVVVTPELVKPVAAGGPVPGLNMAIPWPKDTSDKTPRTPGADVTGPPNPIQRVDTVPIEQLKSSPLSQPSGPGAQDTNGTQTPSMLPASNGTPGSQPPGSRN